MLGLWGLALGLFPIWDAYELGRKEWFTELGVGVIAGVSTREIRAVGAWDERDR